MLAISRTPPFRQFQRSAGNATFHINTVVIGLELVARGSEKPAELNINWNQPKNLRQSTEQTKRFVLLAVINQVVDSFDVLLRDYADLDWLTIDNTTRDLIRKSITKPGGKEYSIGDRTTELMNVLQIKQADSVAFLALTVAWRNTLVHFGRAKPILPDGVEEQLKGSARQLSTQYAAIDVVKMLHSFWERKRPTLKEATTIVAVCQNLARAIDETVIHNMAGTTEQISSIVRKELARSFRQDPSRWKNVWGRDAAAQERALLNHLAGHGITPTEDAISAVLEPALLLSIASQARAELAVERAGSENSEMS